ncbi:TPA: hypothetical protein N2B65_006608 [Pseudomonas aeruginosa]|uniref:sodium:solute symporter family transporter n=1 Tax=Pseudomonas putida TaxID=303 RepID=UPI0009B783DD|nr:hypothetical protein [Pseudomonas putida]HCL3968874.1 hypothetical protein [Pseudomonas aeruginosa]
MDEFVSPIPALAIIVGIASLLVIYGVYSQKRLVKNSEDFVYAGRSVGLAISSGALIATWITGNTVMSAPEQAYTLGIMGVIGYGLVGLSLVLFAPLAMRIKRLMPNGYTSGEFISLRYGKWAWRVYIVLSIYYLITFLVTQAMAGGILVQALTGLDYRIGLLTVLIACTLYTTMGGLKAVLGTDFVIAVLILITVSVTGIIAFWDVSPSAMYASLRAESPNHLNVISAAGMMFIGSIVLQASGEIFHSNIWWQRLHACREELTKKSFVTAGLIFIPVPIATGFIAIIALVNSYDVPQVNMVFPIVAGSLMGSVGGILVLIIVFTALLSTVSALLIASGNLIIYDFVREFLPGKISNKKATGYVRWTILCLFAITLILTWTPRDSMFQIILLTGPAVASMIWPICYGIYNKRSNRTAATVAFISGTAVGIWAYFSISSYAGSVSGAVVSGLVMLLATTLWPDDSFEWSDLNSDIKIRKD